MFPNYVIIIYVWQTLQIGRVHLLLTGYLLKSKVLPDINFQIVKVESTPRLLAAASNHKLVAASAERGKKEHNHGPYFVFNLKIYYRTIQNCPTKNYWLIPKGADSAWLWIVGKIMQKKSWSSLPLSESWSLL